MFRRKHCSLQKFLVNLEYVLFVVKHKRKTSDFNLNLFFSNKDSLNTLFISSFRAFTKQSYLHQHQLPVCIQSIGYLHLLHSLTCSSLYRQHFGHCCPFCPFNISCPFWLKFTLDKLLESGLNWRPIPAPNKHHQKCCRYVFISKFISFFLS